MAWLKAIRLQFYPMTLIAYAAGAFAADTMGYGFSRGIFWLGFSWLFLVELSTVFSNDFFDYRSDQTNPYFGPFTGGSRVIVEKELSFKEIKTGIILSLLLSLFVMLLLLFSGKNDFGLLTCISVAVYISAVGYTIPPLKLSYRGLGEIDVAFTHSVAVIICGYAFQGGKISDPLPWLISFPLFLSVLPSILLAGIPDYVADQSAGKATIAVRFGKKAAAEIAMALCIAAAILIIGFKEAGYAASAYNNLVYLVIPHAILLVHKINQYIKNPRPPHRIDSLLIIALSYLVWFALIPLINLSK